jgi:hypothetical protein
MHAENLVMKDQSLKSRALDIILAFEMRLLQCYALEVRNILHKVLNSALIGLKYIQ